LLLGSVGRGPHDGIREIDMLQQELHDDLAAFVYDRLRRRPMVLPVVVEV
jgi:ribonuclease J